MRINKGAILLARKTLESDIFFKKPHVWFKIWCTILLLANHKDVKQFKRGEAFTTYQELCHYSKATHSELDHCLRWLKSATQIATRKATRGMYIKVIKYNIYQQTETYKSDTKSDNIGEKGGKIRSDTRNKNENSNTLTRMGPVKKYASNEAKESGFNPMQKSLERYKIK